jgi:phosphoheptose isomerase
LKIFHTQLTGLTNRLVELTEEIEDAARLIAQSVISDGNIYWASDVEMSGVVIQACSAEDRIIGSQPIHEGKIADFSAMDTLVIASASMSDTSLLTLIDKAKKAGATVIAISSNPYTESVVTAVDFTLPTGVAHGLVPLESGKRIGSPHLLMGLYIYYHLFFAVTEILEEHEG